MLVDLEELDVQPQTVHPQVCIIGAGLAGHSLAQRLAAAGICVTLLEAGGRLLEDRSQRVYDACMARLKHNGTYGGRFRVLGGSSTRWGGQLLPYTSDILQPPPSVPSCGWPLGIEEVAPFYPDAERLLCTDDLPYEAKPFLKASHRKAPALLDELPELNVRFSKCAPFSHRNLSATVGKKLERSSLVTIYLHANLTELLLTSTGNRIEAALVRNYAGGKFRFEASHFVLCAGTIETSRLLLASRSVEPRGVGNAYDQVGRYFHDHIKLPAAELTGDARRMFLQSFGPFLVDGTMHKVKFEASPQLRERLNLLAVMAHIVIDEPEDSGATVARSLLRSLQRGDIKDTIFRELQKVPHALVDMGHLGYLAKVEKRRHASRSAAVILYLSSEQLPLADTRICLDDDLDHLGMPKAVVDWTVSDIDLTTLRRFAGFVRERFDSLSIGGIQWQPQIFNESAEITGIKDTFHPMGGCRMGTNPRESVVDSNLTVHGIPNLSIASAAVFPSGGSSNPSFTIIALALRLADRLATQLRL